MPALDDVVRLRLRRRFGTAVDTWLDGLPAVLGELAERWGLESGGLVHGGSRSVVVRCRTADGRAAVLKASPERRRLAEEAAALASWRTPHVPAVLAADEARGALLLEAIEPGTPLADAPVPAGIESLGALLGALHAGGVPAPGFRPVADRVAELFDASRTLYERDPALVGLVPPELYERSRALALRLAADPSPTVLLHGDLTPVNVLDGGEARGLVAIDPATCLGDPAFDAVDFVFWRAGDAAAITARAGRLARAIGAAPERLLDWCAAFAAMVALEQREAGSPRGQVEPFLALAARV